MSPAMVSCVVSGTATGTSSTRPHSAVTRCACLRVSRSRGTRRVSQDLIHAHIRVIISQPDLLCSAHFWGYVRA